MSENSKIFTVLIFTTALLGATYIFSNQFFNMPVKNNEFPRMENPLLIITKSKRELQIFDGESIVKTYKIALGFAPDGDKNVEGDGKTPLGDYYIFTKNNQSKFFLSLGVSYPNIEDAKRGLSENLISKAEYETIIGAVNNEQMPPQKTKLGGDIYIHGGGTISDWTQGCIALENGEIQEIFNAIPVGVRVKILP